MCISRPFIHANEKPDEVELPDSNDLDHEFEKLDKLEELGYPIQALNEYVLNKPNYKNITSLILHYHDYLIERFNHEEILKMASVKPFQKNVRALYEHYFKLKLLEFSQSQIAKIAAHRDGAELINSIVNTFSAADSVNKADYLSYIHTQSTNKNKRKFNVVLNCIELIEIRKRIKTIFPNETAPVRPFGAITNDTLAAAAPPPVFSFFQPAPIIQATSNLRKKTKAFVDFPTLVNKTREAIKQGREGNNALTNCGHLTLYAIQCMEKIIKGEELQPTLVTTENSGQYGCDVIRYRRTPVMDAALLNQIKSEDKHPQKPNEVSQVKPATKIVLNTIESIRNTHGLYAYLPPRVVAFTNIGSPNYPSVEIDHNTELVPRTPINIQYLNNELRKKALELNAIIIGDVRLTSLDKKNCSHVLAYYADNQGHVFFVDGQNYNGITHQGDPIMFDLTPHYHFESLCAPHEANYYAKIFYHVYKTLDPDIGNWLDEQSTSNKAYSIR